MRLQALVEAEALRTQNRQLGERIDRLVLDNDWYRRALGNRVHQDGNPRNRIGRATIVPCEARWHALGEIGFSSAAPVNGGIDVGS